MGEIIPIDIQASFSIEDKKMNGKFKLLASSLLLAAALGVSSQANALVIDDFNTGQSFTQAIGGASNTGAQTAASGAIGGFRRMDIASTGNPLQDGTVAANIDPGKLSISNDSTISSSSTIIWNADQGLGVGLGGVDLTAGGSSTALVLNFVNIDAGTASITFRVTEANTGGSLTGATAFLTFTASAAGLTEYFYSDFTNYANVDFTNVRAIRMIIDAPTGSDLSLDLIETNRLPEPSSLVLMSLGLAGFSLVRRKKAA